jgi:formylglycine-generating enzyme required for sulfatase activity
VANPKQEAHGHEWLELRRSGPAPVGALPFGHTLEGLWDMAGNVSEWCASLHRELFDIDVKFASESVDTGIVDPVVHRGGEWQLGLNMVRLDQRGHKRPSEHEPWIGFRVVCRPPASSIANSDHADSDHADDPIASDFDDAPTPVDR